MSPTWTATLSVTPETLEHQLSWLTQRGWHATTFYEALQAPEARRTLAVTFDDAFASVLTLAHPVLASLGLPATVFTPTSFVTAAKPLGWPGIDHWAQTPSAQELSCLSWDGLGELAQAGWEIGSHTRTHPHLTSLDAAALAGELSESRAEITERLGTECRSVAYPFGDVDRRVADAARTAGYTVGASMSRSLAARGVLRWPRVGIYHDDGVRRFRLKTTRTMRWLRTSRLWPED